MEYLALYRKYRPKELDEVVGQNEIKKILANSVKNGTISHAYLFSGPRGTGKTTMAKILAKMVNCENPIDGNACNKCNSCLNVLNSNDVIEIDAASNNGVDEIRELREKTNLVPSMCKYKVYIIDEVHMLTTQAFNALLKTLEEPPKHVIFVLATTEYYKIPLTITSRCQKFQFNKISIDDIIDHLKKIAKLEKITISDEAIAEIAKISDGGMRDSINFLDQLRSFNGKKISINDVYDVCGNVSSQEMVDLFTAIRDNNAEKLTLFFEKMDSFGKNYNKFFEDVVCILKDIILYKKDVSRKYIKYDCDCIATISNLYSLDEIYVFLDGINNLMDKLKNVSRQSVVVTANFLLIMNKINSSNDIKSNINESTLKNKEEETYEMAFNFTDNNTLDESKLTSESLNEKENNVNEEKYNLDNKKIIINNTLALADKNIKSSLQKKFVNINDYLADIKYSSVAGFFVDTAIEAAGDGYLILSGNYDAVIDNVYQNYKLCNEFINKILDGEYHFAVITNEEWDKYKKEYINNKKNGIEYQLMEIFQENDISNEEKKKEPTVVDKLFELVGEDTVEFK